LHVNASSQYFCAICARKFVAVMLPPPPPPPPPLPPPPPPGPPPGPPPKPPQIHFRDEVIPWIGTDDSDDADDDDDSDDEQGVADQSGLFGDDIIIETGVTSGADPSAWDPIGVDRRPDSPGNAPLDRPPNTPSPGE
jgi:hypothetical protein